MKFSSQIKATTLISIFILTVYASQSLHAQDFYPFVFTPDTLTYVYELPLIHFEYNRFKPMHNYVYQGQSTPVTLKNTRPRQDIWMDVRIDFDQSDGVNFSNWYLCNSAPHHLTVNYQSVGKKIITTEIRYTTILGQTKNVTATDTIFVVPTPTHVYSDGFANRLFLWQSGAYDKPVLYVEGYDPLNDISAGMNYQIGYDAIAEALQSGYDILLVDWGNGGASIQDNSEVLKRMMTFTNELLPDGVEACTQIIGISMGGVVARFALADIEEQYNGYLNPRDDDALHYTNTFISYDAPQQGAHINHDFQSFVQSNADVPDEQKARLSAPAARQLLEWNSYANGPGEYLAFQSNIRNLNNPLPGQENSNGGYPELCKKYAVSNGSYQPIYNDKQAGVTELGYAYALPTNFTLNGLMLAWDQVRTHIFTQKFITENRDYWPGSTFPGDITKLNRYSCVNPFRSRPIGEHLFAFFLGAVLNVKAELQFNYNPGYQPTESALDFKALSFTRSQNGAITPGQSYFDGFQKQSVSFRHDYLPSQAKDYMLDILNTHRLDPILVRVANISVTSTQRTVTFSFQENSIYEQGTLIERKISSDTAWLPWKNIPNNTFRKKSFVLKDTNLIPATNYLYRIRAYNGTNYSGSKTIVISTLSLTAPDTISVATTWDDNVTVNGTLVITGNGSLTIEPGNKVIANANASIILKPGGKLNIVGTPTQPITFTSSGSQKWNGISLSNFPQSPAGISLPIHFRHVVVENAKIGIQAGAGFRAPLLSNYASLSLSDMRIRNCDVGISGEGYVTFSLKNSTIENCSTGIALRNMNLPKASLAMENDSVKNCETGLYLWNTAHAKVMSSYFEGGDASSTGIALNAFSFLELTASKVSNFSTGVILADRNYLSMSCSEITQNETGILLNGESASLRAKGSLIHDNSSIELQCVDAIPDLDKGQNGLYDIAANGHNLYITKARYPIDARENYWGGLNPRISSPVAVNTLPMLPMNPGINCNLLNIPNPQTKKGKIDQAIIQLTGEQPDSAWSLFQSVYAQNQDSLEMHWAFPGLIASALARPVRDLTGMISTIQNLPGAGNLFTTDRDYTANIGTAFQGSPITALSAISARLQHTTTAAETLACRMTAKEIGYLPVWQYPDSTLASNPGVISGVWMQTLLAINDMNNLLNHHGVNSVPKQGKRSTTPSTITLSQNYPNPFSTSGGQPTIIKYGLPGTQRISLIVYDMLGREVRSLVDETKQAGEHSIAFDASSVASGVYYYRLVANGQALTRKMTLMK